MANSIYKVNNVDVRINYKACSKTKASSPDRISYYYVGVFNCKLKQSKDIALTLYFMTVNNIAPTVSKLRVSLCVLRGIS